jgi:hypothetical protein
VTACRVSCRCVIYMYTTCRRQLQYTMARWSNVQ